MKERSHVPQRVPPNSQINYKERPFGHERAIPWNSGGGRGRIYGGRGNGHEGNDREKFN